MKILRKLKEKWMRQMINQWNYPVDSKELHADIFISFGLFFLSGIIIGIMITSEGITTDEMVTGLLIGIAMAVSGFFNLYYWTFKQMKAYENRYGKTGLGNQFKQNFETKKGIEKIWVD